MRISDWIQTCALPICDHVLISCITSCARCEYCRRGMYSHCADGGWILGNTIDGTQAEFVRIPHADNRSEEHTSELQSLMRISYAVFCLKKKKITVNSILTI